SFTVLVTKKLPEAGLTELKKYCDVYVYDKKLSISKEELLKIAPTLDAVIAVGTRIDEEFIKKAEKLKIVSSYGVGYDNINVETASKRNIIVTNLPDVVTESTAELTMALMLSLTRRIIPADNYIRKNKNIEWNPMLFMGNDLYYKKLGIVGFGRIGRAVARRAISFGMQLYYYDVHEIDSRKLNIDISFLGFEELIKEVDYITLHVPYFRKTHHLIDRKTLESIKSSAYIINASRGPVIDEKALIEALKNKQIAGAALDVFENDLQVPDDLKKFQNVVLTPHIGTSTVETRVKMASIASEKIIQVINGQKPKNIVNEKEINI
ncbi:MAG: D-glycerate dehydrogenase, partial [Atribacterota bacterium]|nr:D-glycerate dehydrogenase [Atribacterota bacterium]